MQFIELLFCVAKLGRFDDSTGGVGFGKEKKQNAPALEIFERDEFVFVGPEAEGRGFVAGLEHGDSSVRADGFRPEAIDVKYTRDSSLQYNGDKRQKFQLLRKGARGG